MGASFEGKAGNTGTRARGNVGEGNEGRRTGEPFFLFREKERSKEKPLRVTIENV